MIYPYAPYFFTMFQEIPWNEFRYEDDEVIVSVNKDAPYAIKGGAAFELIAREFQDIICPKLSKGRSRSVDVNRNRARLTRRSSSVRRGYNTPKLKTCEYDLHTLVDPTGDIDVVIPYLNIKLKDGRKLEHGSPLYHQFFLKDDTYQWRPYHDQFSIWLCQHIISYLEKISYNFKEWFPAAVEFDIAQIESLWGKDNVFMMNKDGASDTISPLVVIRSQEKNNDYGLTSRIQVSMTYEYVESGTKKTSTENLIEFIYVPYQTEHKFLKKHKLWISAPIFEMFRNYGSIDDGNRLKFISKNKELNPDGDLYRHKFYNHIYRSIYLINVIALLWEKHKHAAWKNTNNIFDLTIQELAEYQYYYLKLAYLISNVYKPSKEMTDNNNNKRKERHAQGKNYDRDEIFTVVDTMLKSCPPMFRILYPKRDSRGNQIEGPIAYFTHMMVNIEQTRKYNFSMNFGAVGNKW